MPRQKSAVYGHDIAPCRVTRTGAVLAVTRLVLPFIGSLALLDLLIWAIARGVFDACYGVWCWF